MAEKLQVALDKRRITGRNQLVRDERLRFPPFFSLFQTRQVVTGKRIYYTEIIRMKGLFELTENQEESIGNLWIALI